MGNYVSNRFKFNYLIPPNNLGNNTDDIKYNKFNKFNLYKNEPLIYNTYSKKYIPILPIIKE